MIQWLGYFSPTKGGVFATLQQFIIFAVVPTAVLVPGSITGAVETSNTAVYYSVAL